MQPVFLKYLQWAEKKRDISPLSMAEHWIRHFLTPEKERDISPLGRRGGTLDPPLFNPREGTRY